MLAVTIAPISIKGMPNSVDATWDNLGLSTSLWSTSQAHRETRFPAASWTALRTSASGRTPSVTNRRAIPVRPASIGACICEAMLGPVSPRYAPESTLDCGFGHAPARERVADPLGSALGWMSRFPMRISLMIQRPSGTYLEPYQHHPARQERGGRTERPSSPPDRCPAGLRDYRRGRWVDG